MKLNSTTRTSKWQTNNVYCEVATSYYSRRLAHVLQPQGTLEGTHPPLAVNGWNQTAFRALGPHSQYAFVVTVLETTEEQNS